MRSHALSDESLFREVDEEVRQEQFKKLWARYGKFVIGLVRIGDARGTVAQAGGGGKRPERKRRRNQGNRLKPVGGPGRDLRGS
jgi:hypothetical protein